MNSTLRTLIVDDERLARKRLRALLAECQGIEVVGEAGSVPEAAAQAAELRPGLVMLDVQMAPATGFDLLPLLPAPAPAVVFVTAHDQHAVRAFEVSAVDYLLKPVSPKRLSEALGRVRRGRAPLADESAAAKPLASDDVLILRDNDRVRRVPLSEIAAVVADGHYTRVLLAREAPMFIFKGVKEWERQLPGEPFLRVDRSLIVNLERVKALETQSRDQASVVLAAIGGTLTLGRTASARLRAAIAS